MRALVLLLVALLSGCLSDDAPHLAEVAEPPAPLPDVIWAGTCVAPLMVPFPDFETVTAMLPAGMHPADAQEVFQTAVATGRGLVLTIAIHCPDGTDLDAAPMSLVGTGILIEPPQGFEDRPGFDLFATTLSTHGHLADLFEAHGWNITRTQPEVTISQSTALSPVGLFQAEAIFEGSAGAGSFEVAGGVEYVDESYLARFWHADRSKYWAFEVPSQPVVGTVQCSFPAGAPEAQILGGTSCATATNPQVGGGFPDFRHEGRIVHVEVA